ncbi:MAG: FIST C-terminal domain-containing protein, partial [Clostridiales bacterium]|nr:FIST C-terminal domain-containing protein [Clostridiales bacterium]
LSAACGHVPIFGAISTDDAPPYNNSYVIYNGKLFKNRLALLLVAGDFEPEFAVVSLPKEKAFNYKAEITEADGNILKSVNGQTMVGYFSQIGLAENGKIRPGVASMPFFLNFGDEAGYNEIPVTRAMFGFTPENYTICGGNMPIGAEIVVGTCEKADVLRLAGALSASIAKQYPGRSALFISCVGRRFALGVDMQSEANAVRDAFAGGTYMFAYGAGEVAPVVGKDGGRVNRFHNYTLIACIL